LRASGLGVAVLSTTGLANASRPNVPKGGVKKCKLGVASYTLRQFTQEQALDMTLRCGLDRITFKSMHLPLDSGNASIKNAVALCNKKGIRLYGGGVISIRTQEDANQAFEYAKKAEMDMIIADPGYDKLEYLDEMVKKYDIKVAIHNHGPGDHQLYPSANSAYEKIKNMDKRMGLCVDIGHTTRIGRDPGKDITDCFDRVFDIHIKDVTAATPEGETCIIGRGVIDFQSFLKTVIDLNYTGTLAMEYEAEKDDPLPGMMESIGYVKGILATI